MSRRVLAGFLAQLSWGYLTYVVARAVVVMVEGRWGAVTVTWPELLGLAVALAVGIASTAVATRPEPPLP